MANGFLTRIKLLVDERAEELGSKQLVASSIGASVSAMGHWMDGSAAMPLQAVVWLAAPTHTSLDWVVYGDMYDRFIVTGECDE